MYTAEELIHRLAIEVTRIQKQAPRTLTDEELYRHLLHTTFTDELNYLLTQVRDQQAMLDKTVDTNNNLIERPVSLDCDVVRFQNNKDKWIAFVGLYNNRPYEIFTGLADDEYGIALPKSVVKGKIIRANLEDSGHHRYDFQFVNSRGFKTTIEGLSYKFDKEFWNYARLISGMLRYGMPIEQAIRIISSLQLENESINSWTQGVARALKRYSSDNQELPE